MAERTSRPWFRLLRASKVESRAARSAAEERQLWALHARAAEGVKAASGAAARVATHAAKQRASLDAALDRARTAQARVRELAVVLRRVADLVTRLDLVALNASLEGARYGEGLGRALGTVGGEVRGLAGRSSDVVRELEGELNELDGDLGTVFGDVGTAREAAFALTEEAARAASSSGDAERALGELDERLRRATGSDPETSKALAEATEHARALVSALGTLSGSVPRGLVVAALRPVLEPLDRLLDGEPTDPEPDGPGGAGT